MPPNVAVVSDHDEVVDLRPVADAGHLQRASIDAGVRADLGVGADFHPADLGDLPEPCRTGGVPETVGAEDRTRVDFRPGPHGDVVVQDDVRVEPCIGGDPATSADDDMRLEDRAVRHVRTLANDRVRTDLCPGADARSRFHDGRRMDTGPR